MFFELYKICGGSMFLISGAIGFMSGVLLMFFLLGLRVSEDRVVNVTGTLNTHNPAKARTPSAKLLLGVHSSQA
jgi:hypothetical protein